MVVHPLVLVSYRGFWLAQAAGWLAYGVITFLAALPLSPGIAPGVLLGYKMGWATAGFIASSGLGAFYARAIPERTSMRRLLVTALAGSTLFAPMWLLLHRAVAVNVLGAPGPFLIWAQVPRMLTDLLFTLLVWSGAYLSCRLWAEGRAQERRALEARALAREAQLGMLRYQLDPHFLFNSLTSIRALVLTDPPLAHRMVTELAAFLRASLRRTAHALTPLAEEVETARRYLSIEQVRFREALDVSIEVDDAARECLLPEFLVHTLVENAIKHGMATPQRPLRVRIVARAAGREVTLEVANTGRLGTHGPSAGASSLAMGLASEAGVEREGVGLRNVTQRLAAAFPGAHSFSLTQQGEWVRAVLSLPMVGAAHGG